MDIISERYQTLCKTPLDINEHLPTLCFYASQCESVIELGVRGCISSWALAYGLLQNKQSRKKILLNDIQACEIGHFLQATSQTDLVVEYQWKNDLDIVVNENCDMTFIDTWHVYPQLKAELNKFSKITNKYIAMHDTVVDAIHGETIRNGWNADQQAIVSGFSAADIRCGLQRAIDEFLAENKDWVLHEHFTNNHGLTILKKI